MGGDVIGILLVDDHPVVLDGVRTMLEDEPGIRVLGEANSGEEAVQKVGELDPSVVLMDIKMPGMSGLDATRRIKGSHPTTAVIMFTMYDSELYLVEAVRCGAAGYITKDSSRELLGQAIRAAVEGGALLRSELLRKAMEGLAPAARGQGGVGVELSPLVQLSQRETEVLGLLARGYRNRAIAGELSLAEVTVKKHVQSIIGKLGVSDRTQAAILAVRMGMTP